MYESVDMDVSLECAHSRALSPVCTLPRLVLTDSLSYSTLEKVCVCVLVCTCICKDIYICIYENSPVTVWPLSFSLLLSVSRVRAL